MQISSAGLSQVARLASDGLKTALKAVPVGRVATLASGIAQKIMKFDPAALSQGLQQLAGAHRPSSSPQPGGGARAAFNAFLGAGKGVASAAASLAPVLGEIAGGVKDMGKTLPTAAHAQTLIKEQVKEMVAKGLHKLAADMGPETEKLAKAVTSAAGKHGGKALGEVFNMFLSMGQSTALELIGGSPAAQDPASASEHAGLAHAPAHGKVDANADTAAGAEPDAAPAGAADVTAQAKADATAQAQPDARPEGAAEPAVAVETPSSAAATPATATPAQATASSATATPGSKPPLPPRPMPTPASTQSASAQPTPAALAPLPPPPQRSPRAAIGSEG